MHISPNRNRDNSYVLKLSDDELEAIYLILASEEQQYDHQLPDPTEYQFDAVRHCWEIINRFRNGEIGNSTGGDADHTPHIPSDGDAAIECLACRQVFIFGVREKEFFSSRGFPAPKRCKSCRQARREEKQRIVS